MSRPNEPEHTPKTENHIKVYTLSRSKLIQSACFLALCFMLVLSAVLLGITKARISQRVTERTAHLHAAVEARETEMQVLTNDQQERLSARIAFVGHLSSVLSLSDEEAVKLAAEQYGIESLVLFDRKMKVLFPEGDGEDVSGILPYLQTVKESGDSAFIEEGNFGYLKKTQSGNYMYTEVPKDLVNDLAEKTISIARMLGSVSGSENRNTAPESFAFAKLGNSDSYLLEEQYYTGEALQGNDPDAPHLTIREEDSSDQDVNRMCSVEYNGVSYIGCSFQKGNNTYYYCMNVSSLYASTISTLAAIGVFVLILTVLSVLYIFYARRYGTKVPADRTYSESMISRKTVVIAVSGILAAGLFVYYTQTLFSLSVSVMHDASKLDRLNELYHLSQENSRAIRENYEAETVSAVSYAGKLLGDHPELISPDELGELCNILGFRFIVLFDGEGTETATNSMYQGLKISASADQFLSGMAGLFQGYPYVVFDLPDGMSGFPDSETVHKAVGMHVIDPEGTQSGYLLAAYFPRERALSTADTSIGTLAANEIQEDLSLYLIVDPETETVITFNGTYEGAPIASIGLKAEQLSGSYFGKLNLGGTVYYATGREIDGLYAYVLTEYRTIYASRLPISLLSAGLYAVVISILFIAMRPKRDGYDRVVYGIEQEENPSGKVTMVETGGGVAKSTIAASYRVNTFVPGEDATPEERILRLAERMLIGAAVLFLIFCYVSSLSGRTSLILEIIMGSFTRGFNVFAVTRCIFIILAGYLLIITVRFALGQVIQIAGPRGETICRLLLSTTQYISVIVIFYLCLSNLGMDTNTLLASLGLGSLIIGMGARELITDIIAGLFIIFEGDFRVGDVIKIGDYAGMVQEIGLRTTKVSGWNKNVKIINNRNLTNVINMTKRNSFAVIDFRINGDTDLDFLEQIFSEEFQNYKEKYPELIDIPKFMGIREFSGSAFECRVIAEVAELDRGKMEYALSKDIKHLLRKNGVQNF